MYRDRLNDLNNSYSPKNNYANSPSNNYSERPYDNYDGRSRRNYDQSPRINNSSRYDQSSHSNNSSRYDQSSHSNNSSRYDRSPRINNNSSRYDQSPRINNNSSRYDQSPRINNNSSRYDQSPRNNYSNGPRYNDNNNNSSNNYGRQQRNNNYSGNNSPQGNSGNGYGNDSISQYTGRFNNLNNDIKAIKDYIDRLELLYNKSYNEVRINENTENKRRIAELEDRITSEIQDVTNALKNIKTEASRNTNPKDRKMIMNHVTNTSKKLREVFNLFNEKKKAYAEQKRARMIRQYQIIHQGASREEAERYADMNPGETLQYSMLSGSKAAYDEATRNRDRMEQINNSINELCELFQDMNYMLTTQNEVIQIIDDNVDMAEAQVEEGSKQLTQAIEIRKSSRKKLWIITAIATVVLLILISYVYMVYIRPFIPKSDEQQTQSAPSVQQPQQPQQPEQQQQQFWN